jgi:multidrug efflux pump subunit AcrA (membrane-fusion protein)
MVAGKIDRINVNEGQNVGQGQLIATLDPSNCSIAKEITDVQVNQASDEYSRLKLMHYRNSLSGDLKNRLYPARCQSTTKITG